MGGAVFPPCYLTWGQTMVEVMEIMVTSFKMSHAHTATLSVPSSATGHRQPTSPPETPGHSRASLDQPLVGLLLLSPGSWCTQGFICASKRVSPVLYKFWRLYGGWWWPPPRGFMLYPALLHPEPLPLQQSTAHLHLLWRRSNTVLSQSLWGLWVLVCTRYVWTLWASLVGIGCDSDCDFAPPTILLGLLLCPWTWGISSKLLQRCTAATPAPTILLGLLCPWTWLRVNQFSKSFTWGQRPDQSNYS